jgi:hypothetical protein
VTASATKPTPSATATKKSSSTTAPTSNTTPPVEPVEPADSKTPWWPWLLLALAGAGLLGWLGVRSSRRRGWDTRFGVARDEARWMATSYVPSLADRALPPAQAAQYWSEGRPRLDELQAELTALGNSAPDPELGAQLTLASTSLAALAQAVDTDVALRGALTRSADADAALAQSYRLIEERRASLLAAIGDGIDGAGPDGYPDPNGYGGPPTQGV